MEVVITKLLGRIGRIHTDSLTELDKTSNDKAVCTKPYCQDTGVSYLLHALSKYSADSKQHRRCHRQLGASVGEWPGIQGPDGQRQHTNLGA